MKPPVKPTKPKLENTKLPDKKHTWIKERGEIDIFAWEAGDYHNGPKCAKCDYGGCHHCESDIYENKDCLREQAEWRNAKKEVSYKKKMEKYKHQLEYYKTIKPTTTKSTSSKKGLK